MTCLELEAFPSAEAAVSLGDAHENRLGWPEAAVVVLSTDESVVIENRVDRRLLATNDRELMDVAVFSNDDGAAVMLDDAIGPRWCDVHRALATVNEHVEQVVSLNDVDVGAVVKDCFRRYWSRPNPRVISHAPSISRLQTDDVGDWENFADASIVTWALHDGGFCRRLRRHVCVRHGGIVCSNLANDVHLCAHRDACCLRRVVGADRCSRSVSRRDDR